MSSKTLIVNNKYLYDILNEISKNINLKIVNGLDKDIELKNFDNHLFLSTKKIFPRNNQLIIREFPIKIRKLVQKSLI